MTQDNQSAIKYANKLISLRKLEVELNTQNKLIQTYDNQSNIEAGNEARGRLTRLSVNRANIQVEVNDLREVLNDRFDDLYVEDILDEVNRISYDDLNNNLSNLVNQIKTSADQKYKTRSAETLVGIKKKHRSLMSSRARSYILNSKVENTADQLETLEVRKQLEESQSARELLNNRIDAKDSELEQLKKQLEEAKKEQKEKGDEENIPGEGEGTEDIPVPEELSNDPVRTQLASPVAVAIQEALSGNTDFLTPDKSNGIITLSTGFDLIGVNNVDGTQLLHGDILDPRQIHYILPNYDVEDALAYMLVINLSGKKGVVVDKDKPGQEGSSEDEELTYDPAKLPSVDTPFKAGDSTRIYNQFSLNTLTETHQEKFQIEDTMSEGQVAFSFGRAPNSWMVSGTLINDRLHDWYAKFRELWDKHIRASQLIANGSVLLLVIPSAKLAIECYPVMLSMPSNVQTEVTVPFSMSFFVKDFRTTPGIQNRLAFSATDSERGQMSRGKTITTMAGVMSELVAGQTISGGE